MKIFITGASDYVGNKLAHVLADKGHTVHALVRATSATDTLLHPAIKIFTGDILDKKSIEKAMEGCVQVYHTAGVSKLWARKRDIFYEQNVGGTKNILDNAYEQGIKKIVYTSSCGVWSAAKDHLYTENDPRIGAFDNDYDLSKHLAEKAVKEYTEKGCPAVIVNPPRIYGPGLERSSSGVNRFISLLLNRTITFLPWHVEAKANYTLLDDVVNGHILAMEKGVSGERYILGGENISYTEFIHVFKKITGFKKVILRLPTAVLKTWGLIELMRGKISAHEPAVTPAMLDRFVLDKTFDSSKAIKQLGYTITPFESGLQTTIDHLKKQKNGNYNS